MGDDHVLGHGRREQDAAAFGEHPELLGASALVGVRDPYPGS